MDIIYKEKGLKACEVREISNGELFIHVDDYPQLLRNKGNGVESIGVLLKTENGFTSISSGKYYYNEETFSTDRFYILVVEPLVIIGVK